MQISTIVPTPHLDLVKSDPYHLCLVHQLRKRGAYHRFYKEQASMGKFVIVDNGAAEFESTTMEEVLELTFEIGASELQLPDTFFDADYTLKQGWEALGYLDGQEYVGSIMAVPQGRNIKEWIQCATELISWGRIDCLGIPKNVVTLVKEHDMGRLAAGHHILYQAHLMGYGTSIHLLGCWNFPTEIGMLYSALGNNIRGVDSGIAAIYAQEGLPLKRGNRKPGNNHPVLNFDKRIEDENLLLKNVEAWRRYCLAEL